MTELYDRKVSVVAYSPQGGSPSQGLELAALRCRFEVHQGDTATPNYVDLRITNMTRQTASRMGKEFTRVQISAGYEGLYGVIFDGTIIQNRFLRENPTDTLCYLVATDGDQAHNQAVVNTTLPAGSTPQDAHKAALSAMEPFGVVAGYTDPQMTGPALPRGKVLFGMAKDVLHDVGRTTDTQWSIQQGRVVVTSRGGYAPTEVVVTNAATGLLGMPVVTPDGIIVRTLLNPLLRIGNRLQLDNNSIQGAKMPFLVSGDPDLRSFNTATIPQIEGDGIYKVLAVDYVGDTRGNDWYSDIVCIGASQGATLSSAQRGRVVPADSTSSNIPATRAGAVTTADPRPLSVQEAGGV